MEQHPFPIGTRVQGMMHEQPYTGTVTSTGLDNRDGHWSAHVAIDQPVYGPSGREYNGVHIDSRWMDKSTIEAL